MALNSELLKYTYIQKCCDIMWYDVYGIYCTNITLLVI